MSTPGRLDILSDVLATLEHNTRSLDTLGQWNKMQGEELLKVWADVAALRDDLHAVANRVESVARAVLDPRHPLLPREGNAA